MSKYLNLRLLFVLLALVTASVAAHNHKNHDQAQNIVETASDAGNFNTLLAAAKAAGLVSALQGDGPFTVFAPTDDAFGSLPEGTITALLKEENKEQLATILSYHVISGQVGSDALADQVSLKTLAGPQVKFTKSENGFTIEGARIIATDIEASNGIVHVIDRVIMPPKQISRANAEQMIMSAINKGAPMFNYGNHEGTARIYAMTAKSLIDAGTLKGNELKRLQQGLNESADMMSFQDRAWSLRHALDDVIRSIRSEMI